MLTRPGYLLFGIVLVSFLSMSASSSVAAKMPQEKLVGAWRLVSVETIPTNGDIIYPFYGKHPQGLLVYDASGWMSVQIVSDPAPTKPVASSREVMLRRESSRIRRILRVFRNVGGDVAKGTVTHHIQQSLFPAERGEEGVRHFEIDGDRLTLTAKTHEMGEEHQRKLVWERVQPQP